MYYENGAPAPEQLPSFALGNHDRFSEDFAPWPGRAGRRRLLVFLRLFVSYRPLTARSHAEQDGARAVQAAPGNQGVIIIISADCRGGECVRNPGANKSTVKGTVVGRRQGGIPRRRRAKTGRNVIKSTRPQKPQCCGALGSSSKFSGLDRHGVTIASAHLTKPAAPCRGSCIVTNAEKNLQMDPVELFPITLYRIS